MFGSKNKKKDKKKDQDTGRPVFRDVAKSSSMGDTIFPFDSGKPLSGKELDEVMDELRRFLPEGDDMHAFRRTMHDGDTIGPWNSKTLKLDPDDFPADGQDDADSLFMQLMLMQSAYINAMGMEPGEAAEEELFPKSIVWKDSSDIPGKIKVIADAIAEKKKIEDTEAYSAFIRSNTDGVYW